MVSLHMLYVLVAYCCAFFNMGGKVSGVFFIICLNIVVITDSQHEGPGFKPQVGPGRGGGGSV